MSRFQAIVVLLSLSAGCATIPNEGPEETTHITLPDISDRPQALTATSSTETASTGFDATQTALVTQAIQHANAITSDPVFLAVVGRLDSLAVIQWNEKKWRLFPDSARTHPTRWLLARYRREGHFRMEDIEAVRFSGSTTASTTACRPYNPQCSLRTSLDPEYIYVEGIHTVHATTNTLVHERGHAFGQEHGGSQKRKRNYCDAPYVLGDLAESLLRFRDENTPGTEAKPISPRQALCPGLDRELKKMGVVL